MQEIEGVPCALITATQLHMYFIPDLKEKLLATVAQEPDSRLTCVTVIPPTPLMTGGKDELSETSIHRQHMVQLQAWAEPLQLSAQRVSFHVIESGDPARALLTFAQGNHVSLIVIGAPTQSPTLLNPRASVAASSWTRFTLVSTEARLVALRSG